MIKTLPDSHKHFMKIAWLSWRIWLESIKWMISAPWLVHNKTKLWHVEAHFVFMCPVLFAHRSLTFSSCCWLDRTSGWQMVSLTLQFEVTCSWRVLKGAAWYLNNNQLCFRFSSRCVRCITRICHNLSQCLRIQWLERLLVFQRYSCLLMTRIWIVDLTPFPDAGGDVGEGERGV